MKRIAIIYNGYLNSKSYAETINIYKEGIRSENLSVEVIKTHSLLSGKKIDFDICLFLDKDVITAKYLESMGVKVLNGSENIKICDDKAYTYTALLNKGINMPKTYISHFKFESSYPKFSDLPPYPFILKEVSGSWGEQVYLINNEDDFCEKRKKLSGKRCIVQEYLKEGNSDIRVITVGKKAICAMKRTNQNDFRSNAEQGGVCSEFILTAEITAVAEKVSKILNLDFAGIDIIIDNKIPYLIEVNSNPFIRKITEVTKVNIGKEIGKYIKSNHIHL